MNIFISYRRAETKDVAGRIADRLKRSAGIGKVFVDVDEIAPGEDFRRAIRQAVEGSPVRLVLVGPQWMKIAAPDGTPRILNPADVVALEVAECLNSKGRTIPVLVNGASMPKEAELPEPLRPLRRLNSLPIRHETFDADFEVLLAAVFGKKVKRGFDSYLSRHPGQAAMVWGATGFIVSSIALLCILWMLKVMHAVSYPLGGSDAAATILVGGWIASGTILPFLYRLRRRR